MIEKRSTYTFIQKILSDFAFEKLQFERKLKSATTSNEGKQKPKQLQNYEKRMDKEQHPFILINIFIAVL